MVSIFFHLSKEGKIQGNLLMYCLVREALKCLTFGASVMLDSFLSKNKNDCAPLTFNTVKYSNFGKQLGRFQESTDLSGSLDKPLLDASTLNTNS